MINTLNTLGLVIDEQVETKRRKIAEYGIEILLAFGSGMLALGVSGLVYGVLVMKVPYRRYSDAAQAVCIVSGAVIFFGTLLAVFGWLMLKRRKDEISS